MKLESTISRVACLAAISLWTLAAQNNAAPTFNKDVLPILQKELPIVPPPGSGSPHAVFNLPGNPAVVQSDEDGSSYPENAAMVCRSPIRAFSEQSVA